ncbi:TPA: hypothetical protein EYH33_07145 [Candidatus Bipolaricaulota bacterium]|nr:hypothetical protein [Candidatus Bipolaricaulota bacterium]
MTGKLLLLAVLLALGTGLVGGLIGVALFSGDTAGLEDEIQGLQDRLNSLQETVSTTAAQVQETAANLAQLQGALDGLRGELASLREAGVSPAAVQTPSAALAVAYVDLTSLVNQIFEPVQITVDFKNQELQDLRQRHEAGEIDDETYQRESLKVQVELLAAPLNWDLTLIQKLAASAEFADIQDRLEELRDSILPLRERLDELTALADQGDITGFLSLYQQLTPVLQQLDQLISGVVQAMLADVTRDIAQAQGFALVLRTEDALYMDEAQLADLTQLVKARVPELFSP